MESRLRDDNSKGNLFLQARFLQQKPKHSYSLNEGDDKNDARRFLVLDSWCEFTQGFGLAQTNFTGGRKISYLENIKFYSVDSNLVLRNQNNI